MDQNVRMTCLNQISCFTNVSVIEFAQTQILQDHNTWSSECNDHCFTSCSIEKMKKRKKTVLLPQNGILASKGCSWLYCSLKNNLAQKLTINSFRTTRKRADFRGMAKTFYNFQACGTQIVCPGSGQPKKLQQSSATILCLEDETPLRLLYTRGLNVSLQPNSNFGSVHRSLIRGN